MNKVISPQTSEALTLVFRHHAEFINTIKSLYGNNFKVINYADDYMQEVYIKLGKYDNLYEKVIKPDGSVSKGYIFFAIRSVVLNDLKKKKVLNMDYWGDAYDVEDRFVGKEVHIKGSTDIIIDSDRDDTTKNRDDVEDRMYEIAENNLHWFDFQLFKTYLSEGKSFRTLAAETGLGIQTIYLSIKKTKMLIADELFEQYSNIRKERC